ncbi:MAG: hypothetical protein WC707_04820 [Candidatus Babeliaceae bacterium]|jgi:hypothetical protein
MNITKISYFAVIIVSFIHTQVATSQKVLIVTHVFNRPDFIKLHKKTFDAFLEDDYEYVVFNDASNKAMEKLIEKTCNKLGVKCIRVPQKIHNTDRNPSVLYADSLQYALDKLIKNYHGIVAMVEADMFLIRPLSITHYLQEYDLIGCHQSRDGNSGQITYILPALVFLNMKTAPNKHLIDFRCGQIDGTQTDTGGNMHHYFKNSPTLRYKLFDAISESRVPRDYRALQSLGFNDLCADFFLNLLPKGKYMFEFHADNHFLHYMSGTNWRGDKKTYLREKNTILHDFIKKSIKYYRK